MTGQPALPGTPRPKKRARWTMSPTQGKAYERRCAARFAEELGVPCSRVPSAHNRRGQFADLAVPGLAVEVKAGTVFSDRLNTGIDQAERAGERTGRPAVVYVYQRPPKGTRFTEHVVLTPEFFFDLLRRAGWPPPDDREG